MPVVSQDLTEDGAVIEVLVGVHNERREMLRKHSFPVPQRVRARLQVDTGSNVTVIRGEVFQQLGIQEIDSVLARPLATTEEPQRFPQFPASLSLLCEGMEMHLPSVSVLGCLMTPADRVDGILGRDVLDHCLFVYDGRGRRFSLAF